jgi:membrane protease subunit (stomatin/prohibitin family)
VSASLNDGANWRSELQRRAEIVTEALDSCPEKTCGAPGDLGIGSQQICPACTKKLDALLEIVRAGP